MANIEQPPSEPDPNPRSLAWAKELIERNRIRQAMADYDMMSQVLEARTKLGPSVLDAESGVPQSQAHPAEDT